MNLPLLSRRQLLGRTAIAAITASVGLHSADLSATLAPIPRLGGALLKPALNAYSFLELLEANAKNASTGIDLFGVCDFCAKLNLEAVDLTGYFFPNYPKVPPDSYVAKIKRHTHSSGLSISGTGVRNDFTTQDKSVRAAGVQVIKEWIEVAARLGAPAVRVFADSQSPFKTWQEASGNAPRETVETWMAEEFVRCAEHAQKFGVYIAVQNHGDFIRTGAEHLSLLKRVDHDWCAALVDTGKYMTDDPYQDIALMTPYAVNWQIKETLRSRTDSPKTDFKKLVQVIRAGGYRGFVPVEILSMHRKDYNPYDEATKTLASLREAIAASS